MRGKLLLNFFFDYSVHTKYFWTVPKSKVYCELPYLPLAKKKPGANSNTGDTDDALGDMNEKPKISDLEWRTSATGIARTMTRKYIDNFFPGNRK